VQRKILSYRPNPHLPESITISGEQGGFIVGFTITQISCHSEDSPADFRCIIPTDCKMCIYDTVFSVGSETIKPVLQEKKAGEAIFLEAHEESRTAILAQNLVNGITEFQLGNVPPGTRCEVSIRVGFA
jgi:hypothetical protein